MIGKGRRRKLSKYRRIDHHHHHHKYKYLPRRHLYYSKRLLRKGGADLVRVGETIPQGKNLVYENPLKQLLNPLTKNYLNTSGFEESHLSGVNIPNHHVGYDFDWNLQNKFNNLDSKGIKELQYRIGTNYAQQLPRFEPNYYYDRNVEQEKELKYLNLPINLGVKYGEYDPVIIDPSNPYRNIKNIGDLSMVGKDAYKTYDNGAMRVTDPLLQFNNRFKDFNADEIEKNAIPSYMTKMRPWIPNSHNYVNDYIEKVNLQQEVLKNDIAMVVNKMKKAVGEKDATQFYKFQKLAKQLSQRVLSSEEITKRGRLYNYAKLSDNYKNDLVNNRITEMPER